MNKFSERFKELLGDTDVKTLAAYMNFSGLTIIYDWKKGNRGISLDSAIKLADYFKCTLDYLFGRSDDELIINTLIECPPFDIQLRKIMQEKKVSQYKLLKDNIVSRGNLNNWFNKKCAPNMSSIIRLSEYLNISIDELVGREV